MKNKRFVSVFFLIILAVIAIGVRVFYINNLMAEVNINEDIYNAAKVNLSGDGLTSVFAGGVSLNSVYIFNLYIAFMVFGNFTVAGVYLNILYQMLSVMLAYIVVRNLSDRYIGFAAGLIAAIFPAYIRTLSEVTILNMEIFLGVLICAAVAFAGRLLYEHGRPDEKRKQKKNAGQQGENEPCQPVTMPVSEILPVPDTSMKEIVIDDLEEQKPDEKINYIENPLPVPKRREHKEMDFAFEPTGRNDDYDIKDVTGKDFYDIE